VFYCYLLFAMRDYKSLIGFFLCVRGERRECLNKMMMIKSLKIRLYFSLTHSRTTQYDDDVDDVHPCRCRFDRVLDSLLNKSELMIASF
jgi:hypothetical protein